MVNTGISEQDSAILAYGREDIKRFSKMSGKEILEETVASITKKSAQLLVTGDIKIQCGNLHFLEN